jgi:hypothetical protein
MGTKQPPCALVISLWKKDWSFLGLFMYTEFNKTYPISKFHLYHPSLYVEYLSQTPYRQQKREKNNEVWPRSTMKESKELGSNHKDVCKDKDLEKAHP